VVLSAGFANLASKKVFDIFDWNGSDSVSYLEFVLALSSFRRDIDWDDTADISRLYYDIFDVNRDDSVSVEILAVVLSKLEHDFPLASQSQKLVKNMGTMNIDTAITDDNGMDTSMSSSSNSSDVNSSTLFEQYTKEVYALVEFIDTDKDGSISYEEFERFLTSLSSLKVQGNSTSNTNSNSDINAESESGVVASTERVI
jgi:Ca2+-binding EF-hand superfamily protein